MKFKSLALLGLASAAKEIKFMQEANDETNLFVLGSGQCLYGSFLKNRYVDLKKFDAEFRNVTKDSSIDNPAHISFGDNDFYYKVCKTTWEMTDKIHKIYNPNKTI